MSDVTQGRLQLVKGDNGPILKLVESGKAKATKVVKERELHPTLAALPLAELDGLAVEYRIDGGQAKGVRPVGAPEFRPPPSAVAAATGSSGRPPSAAPKDRFHNAYNFVPALPRDTVAKDSPLGDHPPAGHDRLQSPRWSGVVHVELTAETPLLAVDAGKAHEDQDTEHKTFGVRADADGRPYLPPTSVKGMLRSAFEAVTNSRFGVWSADHRDRLAFRQAASDGLQMVPARVVDGGRAVDLYHGTAGWSARGPQGPMYAAWWPTYGSHVVGVSGGGTLRHGERCEAWLEQFEHPAPGGRTFTLWRVRSIGPVGALDETPPNPTNSRGGKFTALGDPLLKVEGWACIAGHSIDSKHDERIFFHGGSGAPARLPIGAEQHQAWYNILDSYFQAHVGETGPSAGPEYSRHLLEERARRAGSNPPTGDTIAEGTLCYARLDRDGKRVERLYPVMIGRELYEQPPDALLHDSLHPARSYDTLSPADRVFGWVAGREADRATTTRRAHRGQVRIGPVQPTETAAIEHFTEPVPLSVLGQPKPAQARFYAASDTKGSPLKAGGAKREAYQSKGQGLRGRKMYLHHGNLSQGHWRVDDGGREFIHPERGTGEAQTNQNRSITGWVRPGSGFRFTVHVTNLSDVELGALLWLLDLASQAPGACHRFGGAKPLGFGSVALRVTTAELARGEDWATAYLGLEDPAFGDSWRATVMAFQAEVSQRYGKGSFDQVPFIAAFLAMARGPADNFPVHSARSQPEPEVESYKWFVANDRSERGRVPGLPLPPAAADNGLPYRPADDMPSEAPRPNGRPGGPRGNSRPARR